MASNPAESDGDSPKNSGPLGHVCERCGAVLESTILGKVCAACLMQVGFESDVASESSNAETQPTSVDDVPLTADDTLEAVQLLFPGLEIIEMIGRGGMGIVYKARQTHLGRLVALKLLRAKCSGDPSLAERFTREARALARLSHPNIVGVHDFGQAGDRPFLIMEYVDGVNLRSMLESGTLEPKKAMEMIPAICEALQFAHDEGVVHRDIKPENILIDLRGRVRIADFGLARLMTRSKEEWTLTGTRQVMGTPHYMAPEQIEHPQDVDHRADIYSLGVVIYEMLTGELPIGRFALPSRKINVDIRFDDVVLRTLEKEPTRRYQHATDVQTAVERITTESPSPLQSFNKAIGGLEIIPAHGVLAAAVLDAIVALFFLWEAVFFRPNNDENFLFAIYHGVLAIVLWIGGRHMLNGTSKNWQTVASAISVIPIHIGVFAGWFFFIVRWFTRASESTSHSARTSDNEFSKALQKGVETIDSEAWKAAFNIANRFGKLFGFIISTCKAAWRRMVRGILLSLVWCLVCSGASLGLYFSYGRTNLPTTLHIYDSSATRVTLSTSDDIRMRIESANYIPRTGFDLKSEDLKRSEVQCSLYLADPQSLPSAGKMLQKVRSHTNIYSTDAFVAYYTPSNSIEYQVRFPEFVNGAFVDPHDFKDKERENANVKIDTRLVYPVRPRPSDSIFRIDLDSQQYRPKLNDPKPIDAWLIKSGMTSEQARKTADGLYAMLAELSETDGVSTDDSGKARLIPIADLLDRSIFDPQGNHQISIKIEAQAWVMPLWIGTTVTTCLVGIAAILYFLFRRAAKTP